MSRVIEQLQLRRPATATLAGAVLVVAGFLLAGVSWWFFILSGAGACGPGILRELGVLKDKDEFQRRAAHRAGYHAFLATGFFGFVLVALVRVTKSELKNPAELATLMLAMLWLTWLLSSLMTFWGARKASTRLLLGFGAAWLAFALADAGRQPIGWLMASLPALPFFALALLAWRLPRLAGALMVVVATAMYLFMGYHRNDHMGGLIVNTGVALLLCGPLLGCGTALLSMRREDADAA
ncbi:MAG: hypothetical protein IPK64_18140 [bacterium]|nr:hypothetical protein [bacterium]